MSCAINMYARRPKCKHVGPSNHQNLLVGCAVNYKWERKGCKQPRPSRTHCGKIMVTKLRLKHVLQQQEIVPSHWFSPPNCSPVLYQNNNTNCAFTYSLVLIIIFTCFNHLLFIYLEFSHVLIIYYLII